jgi:hypothetical protein
VDTQNSPVASLLKFFERYFPLNLAARKEVAARFAERSVKRRGFILQQGDVAKYFTFVVQCINQIDCPFTANFKLLVCN